MESSILPPEAIHMPILAGHMKLLRNGTQAQADVAFYISRMFDGLENVAMLAAQPAPSLVHLNEWTAYLAERCKHLAKAVAEAATTLPAVAKETEDTL